MRGVAAIGAVAVAAMTAAAAPAARSADAAATSEAARSAARSVTSFAEACWIDREDYRECRGEVKRYGAESDITVVARVPRRGEVRYAPTQDTYVITAVDGRGRRWILRKAESGRITRTCEHADGSACATRTW